MLVSAAVRCQFCDADVSQVPRQAGTPAAGSNRWQQQDTGPDWWSIAGYFIGAYWLLSLAFKVLALMGGDFVFGGLSVLGALFLSVAFFFRPDWAQQPVRILCAIAIARDLISLAFTFTFAPLAKYTGASPLLLGAFALIDIAVAGVSLYLTNDEKGLF
jgi:hypothetical protein